MSAGIPIYILKFHVCSLYKLTHMYGFMPAYLLLDLGVVFFSGEDYFSRSQHSLLPVVFLGRVEDSWVFPVLLGISLIAVFQLVFRSSCCGTLGMWLRTLLPCLPSHTLVKFFSDLILNS